MVSSLNVVITSPFDKAVVVDSGTVVLVGISFVGVLDVMVRISSVDVVFVLVRISTVDVEDALVRISTSDVVDAKSLREVVATSPGSDTVLVRSTTGTKEVNVSVAEVTKTADVVELVGATGHACCAVTRLLFSVIAPSSAYNPPLTDTPSVSDMEI